MWRNRNKVDWNARALIETQIVDVLKSRPVREQWMHGAEIFDAVREINPRAYFGSVYCGLSRLTWKQRIERKVEPPNAEHPEWPLVYYRAPRGGIRVYDNDKSTERLPAPAPSPA